VSYLLVECSKIKKKTQQLILHTLPSIHYKELLLQIPNSSVIIVSKAEISKNEKKKNKYKTQTEVAAPSKVQNTQLALLPQPKTDKHINQILHDVFSTAALPKVKARYKGDSRVFRYHKKKKKATDRQTKQINANGL
jgi:hypothetical protein